MKKGKEKKNMGKREEKKTSYSTEVQSKQQIHGGRRKRIKKEVTERQ